jgi:hypothetical protein
LISNVFMRKIFNKKGSIMEYDELSCILLNDNNENYPQFLTRRKIIVYRDLFVNVFRFGYD